MMVLTDVIEYLVAIQPGRSARQLSAAIHGGDQHAAEIERTCQQLVEAGRLQASRLGSMMVYAPAAKGERTRRQISRANAPSLLSLFQNLRSDLRLSHARLFVEVAVQEGLSIYEYARRLTLPEATTQTQFMDLARNHVRPALVDIKGNPRDARHAQCILSLEGCRLLARLWDAMEPA